jgi:hypothetical protein
VLLDTCGNAKECRDEIGKLCIGLPILETREIGLENLRRVVFDVIKHATNPGVSFRCWKVK